MKRSHLFLLLGFTLVSSTFAASDRYLRIMDRILLASATKKIGWTADVNHRGTLKLQLKRDFKVWRMDSLQLDIVYKRSLDDERILIDITPIAGFKGSETPKHVKALRVTEVALERSGLKSNTLLTKDAIQVEITKPGDIQRLLQEIDNVAREIEVQGPGFDWGYASDLIYVH